MRSDKHIYQLFEASPKLLLDLLGREDPSDARFESVTIKAIERESDGVLFYANVQSGILVVEWQFYFDSAIYNRIAVAMSVLQEQSAGVPVEGIIVFGSESLDPKTEPWQQIIGSYVLEDLLNRLSDKVPDHPLIAVFQPLIEPNEEILQTKASQWYNQLSNLEIDERTKTVLLSVFVDWILQRFKTLGKKEIEQMVTGQLTPLEETQAGKELIALGMEKGMEKGIERGGEIGIFAGKIQLLQRLLGDQTMTWETLKGMSLGALQAMCDSLESRLSKNR